jgi:hypothetical protein
MVKKIHLFIEGGAKGSNKDITNDLRKGFSTFFKEIIERARDKRIKWKIYLCNDSAETCKAFNLALNEKDDDCFNAILVDSDAPIEETSTRLQHIQNQHNCNLENADEEQCHLMVQVTETWFVADVESVKSYYGKDFNANAIPKTADVEKIFKDDVLQALKTATRKTKKGEYHKIKHAAELLETVEPRKVRTAAKHCEIVFSTLESKIDE